MSWFRRKDKNIQTENSEKKDIKEVLIDDLLEKNKCICGNTIGEKAKRD